MNITSIFRGVAQPGSAPGLGPGGRRFESFLPDHNLKNALFLISLFYLCDSLKHMIKFMMLDKFNLKLEKLINVSIDASVFFIVYFLKNLLNIDLVN